MTIGNRIRGGFGVLAILTFACGMAGYYGVSSLSGSLRYITGPAWDTADGAMEGMIGIEAEMMGIYRLIHKSGSSDSAQALIEDGRNMSKESLGRMRASGLMSESDVASLDGKLNNYRAASNKLLQVFGRFDEANAAFHEGFENFEQLMILAEEVGDGAVEQLRQNPNKAMSWNSGLKGRWTAADGAMETQIGMLRQLYNYERLITGEGSKVAIAGLKDAGQFLDESIAEIINHRTFKSTRVPKGHYSGQSFVSALNAAYDLHQSTLANAVQDYQAYAEQKLTYDVIADDLLRALGEIEEIGDNTVEGAVSETESSITSSYTLVFMTVALSLGVAVFGGLWLVTSITRPLAKARDAMRDIAEGEGDLTQRLDYGGADELGDVADAFNRFAGRIESVVSRAKAATNLIHTGADEMAAGNINLSQRTEEQASSLEETASSMEEMTGTIKQNADNAFNARGLANEVREKAETGSGVMNEAVTAMSSINESSKKIVDIISAIDGIAFQTNLLALNAAVEAARAGDQGRGFAVVASEVRALAQRSAEAAKEIKELIEESASRVKVGSELVDESGKTLMGIVDSVREVTDIISEIAAASHEQSAGIEQVNQAVTQMDDMTQQNAALVEQTAAASRSMQDQAQQLSELVSYFKTSDTAVVSYAKQEGVNEVRDINLTPVASEVVPSANQPIENDNGGWQVFK